MVEATVLLCKAASLVCDVCCCSLTAAAQPMQQLKLRLILSGLQPMPMLYICCSADAGLLLLTAVTNFAGCSRLTCCCHGCLQILMTGEVAGLFPKEELDVIVNDMRPIMKAEAPGKPPPLASWHGTARFYQAHYPYALAAVRQLFCSL